MRGAVILIPEVFVNGMLLDKPEFALMDIDPHAVGRIDIIPPLKAGGEFGTSGGDGVILIHLRGMAL